MFKDLTKQKGDFRIKASCLRDDMGGRVFVGYGDAFVSEQSAWKFKTRAEAEQVVAEGGYKLVFVTMAAA